MYWVLSMFLGTHEDSRGGVEQKESDLQDVFKVQKKGIRLRLLNDIQEERLSNKMVDTLNSDMMVKHSCFILFGVCAIGAMLIYRAGTHSSTTKHAAASYLGYV